MMTEKLIVLLSPFKSVKGSMGRLKKEKYPEVLHTYPASPIGHVSTSTHLPAPSRRGILQIRCSNTQEIPLNLFTLIMSRILLLHQSLIGLAKCHVVAVADQKVDLIIKYASAVVELPRKLPLSCTSKYGVNKDGKLRSSI